MFQTRFLVLLAVLGALLAPGHLAPLFADGLTPGEAPVLVEQSGQGTNRPAFLPLLLANTRAEPEIKVVPGRGIGFDLRVPANLDVRMPDELQVISVVQISSDRTPDAGHEQGDQSLLAGDDAGGSGRTPQRRPQHVVEIAAERLPDTLTYEQWQAFQKTIGGSYATTELRSEPTRVGNQPALFREIQSPDGIIWETELYVNNTVYRVSTLYGPGVETLYEAVLEGLEFNSTSLLPVNNEVPTEGQTVVGRSEEDSAEIQGVTAMPSLKFPFNGTERITCAYYANNSNCHPQARVAVDFGLSYELVRAAHSATNRVNFYDSCGGMQIKLVSSDSAYVTIYSHLSRYLGPSTGSVFNGQYIAVSGATGRCQTGPHLHWILNRSGTNIKPEPTCGQTGFLVGQNKTDCWSPNYRFTTSASSRISINTAEVNLRVCDPGRKGRPVAVSVWRPATGSYAARGWWRQGTLSTVDGCASFTNLEGDGNTIAGVYYYTNVSLYQDSSNYFPANTASQQKASCYSSTNQRILCDRVIR